MNEVDSCLLLLLVFCMRCKTSFSNTHNIIRICIYGNRLGHIPILQGQELLWLERVAHIATRVNCLGGRTLAPSILTSCVYMQRQMKQASRQAMKRTKEIGRACKEHITKESQTGANKSMLSMWKSKQSCYQRKGGVLRGQMQVWIECP